MTIKVEPTPFLWYEYKQDKYQMNKNLIIFQENDLYGARNQEGEIIIPPQYKEMYPFSCGLSLVRNCKNQYAYINSANRQIIPFGKYDWCDPQFTCGFARVKNAKFGIIDTLGNVVVPLIYDKIWSLNEKYFSSINAFIDNEEKNINLYQYAKNIILDGLNYIHIYSIEDFKKLSNCKTIFILKMLNSNKLYFTYGCNIGLVGGFSIPENPIVAIVMNSCGKIFPILIEKENIGKSTLPIAREISTITKIKKENYNETYAKEDIPKTFAFNTFWVNADEDDYDEKDEHLSLLLDALEGDISNYCNIE